MVLILEVSETETLLETAINWANESRYDYAVECMIKAIKIDATAKLWLYLAIFFREWSELFDENYYENALKCAEISYDLDKTISIRRSVSIQQPGLSYAKSGEYTAERIESCCLEDLDRVCSKHVTILSKKTEIYIPQSPVVPPIEPNQPKRM